MASRVPPRLETYLRLPPETSLILLTGVLGSSTNWLVQRYLHCLMAPSTSTFPLRQTGTAVHKSLNQETTGASIAFVSFLRDYAFWKDSCARLGLDLDTLTRKGTFAFVDGLSRISHPTSRALRALPIPAGRRAEKLLSGATSQDLRAELDAVVDHVQSSCPELPIVLVVDQPDLLLAASGGTISSEELRDVLLNAREKVHASIVTLFADEPLITSQTTGLEKEHAAFALSLAHDAYLLMSLRKLDTGTARDVSGVLRVALDGDGNDEAHGNVDQDLLYFVGSDGAVRVFERGE